MKSLLLIGCLLASAGLAAEKYVETRIDPNVEPGRETTLDLDRTYPLLGLPTQVALHPKVLAGLVQLQEKGDKAVAAARQTAAADETVTGAVITAETFARQIPAGEQKFWVFSVSYRKYPKSGTPGAPTVVAHFVSGSYTVHNGNKVFPMSAQPVENLAFLGTFPPKDGPFSLPK